MIRIKHWNETFENADTRKRQRLGWFLCPTGTDSAGYLELMSHGERGIRAFAVFTAICQWSATCLPLVRGSCARSDGRPMSARQIATVIRMPENIVSDALELLSSPDVGWIMRENTDVLSSQHKSAGSMPVPCQSPAGSMPQGEGEGEGKGEVPKSFDRQKKQGDPEFDQFWNIYPHKTAKKRALKAWQTALKETDAQTIIRAAEEFARASKGKELQYIKHPATWLNDGSWEDVPVKPRDPYGKEARKEIEASYARGETTHEQLQEWYRAAMFAPEVE